MESKLGMVGKWGKGKSKCWNQCFTAACGVRWLFESCHKSDKAAQRGNVVWEDDTWNEDYGDEEVPKDWVAEVKLDFIMEREGWETSNSE